MICEGSLVIFSVSLNGGIVLVILNWMLGNLSGNDVVVVLSSIIIYIVMVIDVNGCIVIDEIIINVDLVIVFGIIVLVSICV